MIKKQGSPLDLNMVEILHMKCAQASASSQCFAAMPLSAVGLSPSGSMQHGQGNSQCIDDICCRRCQQDLCCCSRREFFHGVLLRSCFLFGLCIVNHSGLEAAGLATCNSAVTIVLSFGSVFSRVRNKLITETRLIKGLVLDHGARHPAGFPVSGDRNCQ